MTGTLTFWRVFARRDRWLYLWFALGSALLFVSQAWSVDGLYATQADFDRAAAGMESNATFVAMFGPTRALNTTGGQVAWQSTAFGAVVVALMVMFVVGRHTRAEEESGRDELIRSGVVGRYATTTAALASAMTASVVSGAAVWATLAAYGLTAADSLALGVGLTAIGWFFSGTALLAVQLTTSTRASYGLAGAAVAGAYAARAIGDVAAPTLSWLSPIGWYQAMHAFSGLRWWPVLVLLTGAGAAVASAYAVFDRRDFGAGVLASRPGPVRAGHTLGSGLGLAWRLQRPAVISWTLGALALGLTFGTMGNSVEDLVGDSGVGTDMILQGHTDVVDAFYSTMALMLALLTGAFATSSALRPHGEEEAGRVESLLATALPRTSWHAGHVLLTVVGSTAMLLVGGLGLGVSYALVTDDASAMAHMVGAAVAYLPAVLVLSGLARALYGTAPRAAPTAWLALVVAVVTMLFGEALNLPQAFRDLSPYEHLAFAPVETFRWLPFVVLAVVAATLSAVGQLALTRRDLR
ncbi:MAG: hypothetical protein FWD11_10445 [Micrococcales bacterium]|nr:hypothetical protein [Micrococcales bacterium]